MSYVISRATATGALVISQTPRILANVQNPAILNVTTSILIV